MAITALMIIGGRVFMDFTEVITGTTTIMVITMAITGFKLTELRAECMGHIMEEAVGTQEADLDTVVAAMQAGADTVEVQVVDTVEVVDTVVAGVDTGDNSTSKTSG